MRLSAHLAALTAPDAAAFRRYKVTLGKTPFILWPAVFQLTAPERQATLGPLKEIYDALADMALAKECRVAAELL